MAYPDYFFGHFAAIAVLFEALIDNDPDLIVAARIQDMNAIFWVQLPRLPIASPKSCFIAVP